MRRCSASDIVLKVLGLLLLTAAVLKGHELLTVPVANKDLWPWRPFLVFQVEFELALGIWLLSRSFKRLVCLASLAFFALFCGVTLCNALTGTASYAALVPPVSPPRLSSLSLTPRPWLFARRVLRPLVLSAQRALPVLVRWWHSSEHIPPPGVACCDSFQMV
jgi:hypothetical protein